MLIQKHQEHCFVVIIGVIDYLTVLLQGAVCANLKWSEYLKQVKWISYRQLVVYFKDWGVLCCGSGLCSAWKHIGTSSLPLWFVSLVWSSRARVLAVCLQPLLHWERRRNTEAASWLTLHSGCVLMVCSFSSMVPKKKGKIKVKCKTRHMTDTHFYPHGLNAGLR